MPIVTSTLQKMRHHKKGCGTKKTSHYHARHSRYESKVEISEERNIQKVIRGQIKTCEEPLPEIQLLLPHELISQTIREITGQYEDTFQDVWVEVLKQRLNDLDTIRRLAKEINRKAAGKAIENHHRYIYGDIPLSSHNDNGDGGFSLFDKIGQNDTEIDNLTNDCNSRIEIVKTSNYPVLSFLKSINISHDKGIEGFCKLCGINDLLNRRGYCVSCQDYLINERSPIIRVKPSEWYKPKGHLESRNGRPRSYFTTTSIDVFRCYHNKIQCGIGEVGEGWAEKKYPCLHARCSNPSCVGFMHMKQKYTSPYGLIWKWKCAICGTGTNYIGEKFWQDRTPCSINNGKRIHKKQHYLNVVKSKYEPLFPDIISRINNNEPIEQIRVSMNIPNSSFYKIVDKIKNKHDDIE